jgi:hypothetical protein
MDAQRASISAPGWQAETAKLQPINEMFHPQRLPQQICADSRVLELPQTRATESPE